MDQDDPRDTHGGAEATTGGGGAIVGGFEDQHMVYLGWQRSGTSLTPADRQLSSILPRLQKWVNPPGAGKPPQQHHGKSSSSAAAAMRRGCSDDGGGHTLAGGGLAHKRAPRLFEKPSAQVPAAL